MTNRRPDIHCDGCGKYCYSLSHRPDEQVFPDSHYCEKCRNAISRGMRSGEMLNLAWYRRTELAKRQLQKMRKLSRGNIDTIHSFMVTMQHSCTPKERPFAITNEPNAMTPAEWRQISRQKLKRYKKYCNQKEYALLSAYADVAH